MNAEKITAHWIRESKRAGRRVASLTGYDYPTARLLDEAGIPLILVGDSLGMVVLGYPDTTEVTLDEMCHHVRAVSRARTKALVAADLPIHTFDSPEQALASAKQLVAAGAEAVKLEGGLECLEQIRAIRSAGIEIIGHLGMLPQTVREQGGYKIKGKIESEREKMLADAKALEKEGAIAIVLELVHPPVASEVSQAVGIPTLGIGSGEGCTGEIMVIHDLIGGFPWFRPKFAHPMAETGEAIREAARAYLRKVTNSPSM